MSSLLIKLLEQADMFINKCLRKWTKAETGSSRSRLGECENQDALTLAKNAGSPCLQVSFKQVKRMLGLYFCCCQSVDGSRGSDFKGQEWKPVKKVGFNRFLIMFLIKADRKIENFRKKAKQEHLQLAPRSADSKAAN